MLYLETEDLIDSKQDEKQEEEGDYIAPKETIGFEQKDQNNQKKAVIDLDGDLIDTSEVQQNLPDEEVEDSAEPETNGTEAPGIKMPPATEGLIVQQSEKPEKEREDDDVDTLQLAWETLESARVLYEEESKKKGEESLQKQLVRVYRRLGDVGLEAGRNEDAATDYKKALSLLQKYEPQFSEKIGQWYASYFPDYFSFFLFIFILLSLPPF